MFPLIFIGLWLKGYDRFEGTAKYVFIAFVLFIYFGIIALINMNAKTAFALQADISIILAYFIGMALFSDGAFNPSSTGFVAGLQKLGVTAVITALLSMVIYGLNDKEEKETIRKDFSPTGFGGYVYELLFILFVGTGSYLLLNFTLFDSILGAKMTFGAFLLRMIPSVLICGALCLNSGKGSNGSKTNNIGDIMDDINDELEDAESQEYPYDEDKLQLVYRVFGQFSSFRSKENLLTDAERTELRKLLDDFGPHRNYAEGGYKCEKLASLISSPDGQKEYEDIYRIYARLMAIEEQYNARRQAQNTQNNYSGYTGNANQNAYTNQNTYTQSSPQQGNNGIVFFPGCETREALETAYRKLCQVYHPDNQSGDNATFLKMKAEYEMLKTQLS